MSAGDRAVLVRRVGGDGPDQVDPEADPVRAALSAGVSHLLAADDALTPGRWGAHITLCGQQVRGPGAGAADHDFRYCPACVAEAGRWVAGEPQAQGPTR
ncbi:MAG: hypothetical protein ACRDRR_08510 [Pseudonocardiaceae bacterium]